MSTEPTAGIRPGNISFLIDGEVPHVIRRFLVSMVLAIVGLVHFGPWGLILGFIPLLYILS